MGKSEKKTKNLKQEMKNVLIKAKNNLRKGVKLKRLEIYPFPCGPGSYQGT